MRATLALLLTGCAIGAPPGFSPGDTWTMPLVDPLAGGRLLVPVMIHGKGPYLMALDRDAHTTVDPQVANDAGVRVLGETRLDDYSDTTHVGFDIELTDISVGNLTRSTTSVAVVPKPGRFDEDGRRIYGVLGREFLADSLVFGFDRARGIAWLQTQQAFKPSEGASVLSISKVANNGAKVIWQPVVEDAKVGGVEVDMHPDFASVVSQLARERWAGAHAQPLAWEANLPDRSGTPRKISGLAVASATVGGVTREQVAFAPYEDRRWPLYNLDGTLGLDFFRPFAVAADWHHGKIYVKPLEADAATRALRMGRWPGIDVPTVKLDLAMSADGPVLMVRPDKAPSKDVEVIVHATSKSGAVLPALELELPAGTDGFDARLDTRYEGASFEIVDADPFPRMCATTQGCLITESRLPP